MRTLPAGPGLLLMAGLACLIVGALCLIGSLIAALTEHPRRTR